jgi:nucleotide-binding universal stress UspA family protein
MKQKISRVLVAVDGSDQAVNAIRYTGLFFPPSHTEVVLFHVVSEAPEPLLDLGRDRESAEPTLRVNVWSRQVEKQIEEFMERGREELVRAGFAKDGVRIKAQRRKIGVARDILREAEQGYDAVLVGRSGVSDIPGVVVGSVAHKVVSKLNRIPVGVVGGSPDPRKLLIGFDGSQGALRGVDFVCSMLPGKDRVIMLCLLVRSLGIHMRREIFFTAEQETEWLRSVGSRLEPTFPEAEGRLVDAGFHPDHVYIRILENVKSRAETLKRLADEGEYGSIVVGRRGHSAVEEFAMGRVTRKILHLADRMTVWVV